MKAHLFSLTLYCNLSDSFISVLQTDLLNASWRKKTVFNVTHGRLCKRSITEAMECGVSIVLLVKVKFTFYFSVSHHSNIIIYCQNIYTIERKQVFTRVRYGN